MTSLKPFIRITILSLILAFLLIYLGIKYHWVENFKTGADSSLILDIPKKDEFINDEIKSSDIYRPKIIKSDSKNNVIDSMNKEQIADECVNLLGKTITKPLDLELATVNCVMSNYQDDFQNNAKTDKALELETKRKIKLKLQCQSQYANTKKYSSLEKQLLIGICVSDNASKG